MEYLRSKQGLTLIETVIALTLVVVLTTAFAGAMVVGLRSETTVTNLDYASNMAGSLFEYFSEEVRGHQIVNNNFGLIIYESGILNDQDDNGVCDPNEYNFDYDYCNLIISENSFYSDLDEIENLNNQSDDFLDLVNEFKDNESFGFRNDSKIFIEKVTTDSENNNGDILTIYKVILKIYWANGDETGSYKIETILSGFHE